MSVRKGQKVAYKIGKGWSVGKVKAVAGNTVTITTVNGHEVNRPADKLRDPDADEESSSPVPEPAVTEIGRDIQGGCGEEEELFPGAKDPVDFIFSNDSYEY